MRRLKETGKLDISEIEKNIDYLHHSKIILSGKNYNCICIMQCI